MGLAIYDAQQELYGSNRLRAVVDGHFGGVHEEKFYLRNSDAGRYYVGLAVSLITTGYDGLGENGFSGIGFKFAYGERRPTETEWDEINSGEVLYLPDIGSTAAADTYTYHPIWVRVYVPGGLPASVFENFIIRIFYYDRVVGA